MRLPDKIPRRLGGVIGRIGSVLTAAPSQISAARL